MTAPKLPDRYEILSELGSGGMGTVYKVHDKILDKIFALKVLRIDLSSAPNDALRFQKEARAAGNLRHENIVAVIDFGITDSQTPYMVLEYIEGTTLKDVLEESGPLPIEEAMDVFEQIAGALHCAHSQGVVHRDLKPHNIFLSTSEDGSPIVKLFDFGVAKTENSTSMALTAPNAIIGTPAYMSPEQARGGKVDKRSDIYSFGCVMYETLTGKLPFNSDNALELLDMHANAQAPNISQIVPELNGDPIESAIAKCLNKNPADRFQSLQDLLDTFSRHHEEKMSEPGNVPARLKGSKNWVALSISAITVLAILSIIAVGSFFASSKSTKVSPMPVLPYDVESIQKIDWKEYLDDKGTLHLNVCPTADDVIKSIPALTPIKAVDISDSTITDAGLEGLSKFKKIGRLSAHHITFTVRGIKALAKFPSLNHLEIEDSKVSDEAFAEIASIRGLNNLAASNLSANQLTSLGKVADLRGLNGHGVTLDEKSIIALSKIEGLNYFVFDACEPVDGAALSHLSELKHLGAISIRKTPELCANNGAAIKEISKLNKLNQLTLAEDDLTDEYVSYLSKMKNLSRLDIYKNRITDLGFKSLFELKNLKELSVQGCRISKPLLEKFTSLNPDCKLNSDSESQDDTWLEGVADTVTKPK